MDVGEALAKVWPMMLIGTTDCIDLGSDGDRNVQLPWFLSWACALHSLGILTNKGNGTWVGVGMGLKIKENNEGGRLVVGTGGGNRTMGRDQHALAVSFT